MTVFVAANSSPHGAAAVRVAVTEAARRGQPLALLILNPVTAVPDDLEAELAAKPDSVELNVRYRAETEEPADAILDTADAVAASLIVIGSRKRSSQGTYVMGTTTQRVLLDAHAPVLVVKDEYPTLQA